MYEQQHKTEHQYKASDFPNELWNLYNDYAHGLIDRRTFLDGAGKFAVGGLTVAALIEILGPHYVMAQQVPKDDKRIKTEYATYDSPDGNGKIRGLLARPADAKGRISGVIVVHENRGLNPYIEDVVRRLAVAGYLGFGADALTPLGGYPGTDEQGVEMQRKLDGAKITTDFVNAQRWLKAHAECNGRTGAVGFCFGGGVVNQLAVRTDIAAAAPFYGTQPRAEDVPKIKAEVVAHYAENDERINAGIAAYEQALKANNIRHTIHRYPGTQHGFHNDTTPRFDKAAAELAWQRTLDLYKRHLG